MEMTRIVYLGPKDELPSERHIAVVVHRAEPGREKGHFYDTAESDTGGSGAFDWNMDEAIARAERFAADKGLLLVTVRALQS